MRLRDEAMDVLFKKMSYQRIYGENKASRTSQAHLERNHMSGSRSLWLNLHQQLCINLVSTLVKPSLNPPMWVIGLAWTCRIAL
jgi:hypothetical protein